MRRREAKLSRLMWDDVTDEQNYLFRLLMPAASLCHSGGQTVPDFWTVR